MATSVSYRLPTTITPLKYTISLAPDLESFTFEGEETIEMNVAEPAQRIALNASELQVSRAEVSFPGGSAASTDISMDEGAETVTLTFDRQIPVGSASLSLAFTGTLNDQLRGFYRSQYTDAQGQTRYLATTQFEATDARRAFPCWDEPAVKATFDVTLVVPEELAAICNTPIVEERPVEVGKKAVRFAETPKMSTYLLAFVVGDMASVEATAPNGTLVRVWTTSGKAEQGRFAVDNAVRLLGFFNDYFGTPFPLPKLDHIAVPDFAAGAMENWGAITYRETALLFDPENSAANTRQRILEVVAHEMAHMWFGDLVTMEWWDDLWLNESFATFMGDKAVDNLYPEWNMWTQFVSADTNAGLGLDGLRNSHPIEQRVGNPAEIRELFDAISYSKGGAVLRMLEHFLGHDTFREGIRQYIAKHQYGNARTEDLWDALAAASGQPVTEIMNTWIKQTGYPLLTADIQRNSSQADVNLRQERFLYDHLLGEPADDTRWQVPVTLIAQSSQEIIPHLMSERSSSLAVDATANGWLKVNAGQTGFYRASYQPQEWERLRAAVAAKELPAADRLGLQNDAYALMRAGYEPASLFLSLAEAYVDEDDATVWGDLVSNLRGLENLIIDQPFLNKYRDFARGLLERIVGKAGWDAKPGEGHLDVLRRSIVLGAAGSYGDRSVTAEARRRFDSYQRDPASLHPDLRGLVYGLTAQEGDRSIYDTLWEMERKASLHEEKVRLLGSLTRFQQQDILRETLERSFQPEEVRPQDTPLVIIGVAGNRYGRDLAWDFIKRNWDEVDRRYGRGGFAIMRLVGITGGFTDEARAKEVEEFFREHPAPSANRTIQQSLERIHLNAKWLERNRPELASRFS